MAFFCRFEKISGMRIITGLIGVLFFQLNAFTQRTITVKTAFEFLNALGSDRTVIVEAGTYNLTQAAFTPNDQMEWYETYDGPEAILKGVRNLIIVGKGNPKILAEPRYAWVLGFRDVSHLTLKGLTFGHTEAGYCQGGVLLFDRCNNIHIESCNLYGSGTIGISMNDVNNFSCTGSHVYECTYGLLGIYNAHNVLFSKTKFSKTGSFDLIEIISSKTVTFDKCTFSDNHNSSYAPYFFRIDSNWLTELSKEEIAESRMISIKNCAFQNNYVEKFTNQPDKLTLHKNKFRNNNFTIP